VLRRKYSYRRRKGAWVSPVVFGIAAWLSFPSVAAYADLAGLLSGVDGGPQSWNMVLTKAPSGSVHDAELAFNDPIITGAIGHDAGIILPNGEKVAIRNSAKPKSDTPDEERVMRADKKSRIVAVAPMLPPEEFTAGSITGRVKLFFSPVAAGGKRTSFLKPKKGEHQTQVASVFRKDKTTKSKPSAPPAALLALMDNDRGDVLASAYAPSKPDYTQASPFDSILRKEPKDPGRFVPPMEAGDHAWVATALPEGVFSAREQQCLASGIYFEARGESVKGQAAVAQVILNRVRNPAYPDTVCGVVYQNKDWRNRCQFSFACDNIRDRINSTYHWKVAREVAMATTSGKIWLPEVGSATHYHAVYVRPRWAKTMEKVGRIGLHVFYRTYGGGWS
jgi:spore germination cell wall hydrolase CwlJ-like protein